MTRLNRTLAWLRIAALLRFAGSAVLLSTALVTLVVGLMPTVLIVVMGGVMAQLTMGQDSTATSDVFRRAGPWLAVAFVALTGQQVIAPFQEALAVLAARRIDRNMLTDLLACTMTAPLHRVEAPRAVSIVAEVSDAFARNAPTPGMAAAALPRLWARYIQLLSAIAVVAVAISWAVAGLLLLGAMVIRHGQRGSLARFTDEWALLRPARQRVTYLQALGSEPHAAKEIRVLRLLNWLQDRYRAESTAYLVHLWRRRRALLFRPFLVYTAVGFVVAVTTFALLSRSYAVSEGVVVLAVAVQAILVPLRFGVHFPECDVQTQYGMQYHGQIEEYRAFTKAPDLAAASVVPAAPADARLVRGRPHEVRFVDVRFGYAGASREVLRGLNLALEPGRSTALVGVNGAGKTTIVKLLTGGYPPAAGTVTVDGTDLSAIDTSDWCREIAVIFQSFIRFDLSLRENLRLGAAHRPEDPDAMSEALARANANDIVAALPDGIDTVLSPAYIGGTGLSGGEWQRVALARALYAVNLGATVLVLDEPTAHLDVRAEIDFFDRFLELTEGLTTLVISHRFSTVRRADAIAVLADGRITEAGGHDQLLAANGMYAAMFRSQAHRFAGFTTPEVRR